MKRRTSKSKYFYLALFAAFLWYQGPSIMNSLMKEGTRIAPTSYPVLYPAGKGSVSLSEGKKVVIFWASWCGPCKIDMKRFKHSVEDRTIAAENIFAINPFETPEEVLKFLETNPYPFTFLDAKPLAQELKITVTPTEVFVENGTVARMSIGMSIIGILRAESFL